MFKPPAIKLKKGQTLPTRHLVLAWNKGGPPVSNWGFREGVSWALHDGWALWANVQPGRPALNATWRIIGLRSKRTGALEFLDDEQSYGSFADVLEPGTVIENREALDQIWIAFNNPVTKFSKDLIEQVAVELDLALEKDETVNGDLLEYIQRAQK